MRLKPNSRSPLPSPGSYVSRESPRPIRAASPSDHNARAVIEVFSIFNRDVTQLGFIPLVQGARKSEPTWVEFPGESSRSRVLARDVTGEREKEARFTRVGEFRSARWTANCWTRILDWWRCWVVQIRTSCWGTDVKFLNYWGATVLGRAANDRVGYRFARLHKAAAEGWEGPELQTVPLFRLIIRKARGCSVRDVTIRRNKSSTNSLKFARLLAGAGGWE